MYISTKTFTHSMGLSCCFRQWRAKSHCRFLHGYALEIRIEFAALELDERNWVIDFGSLKSLKAILEEKFDHKTLVAEDDPDMFVFDMLQGSVAQIVVVKATGCEAFAKMIYDIAKRWLADVGQAGRVVVHNVEVREHAANSAIYSEFAPLVRKL